MRSWEKEYSNLHSTKAIQALKEEIRVSLRDKYETLAASMFRYDFGDLPFREMSYNTFPERLLYRNGQCLFFDYGGLQCLPPVARSGLNIYGFPVEYGVQPYGWDEKHVSDVTGLTSTTYTAENSVLMRNNRLGRPDRPYVDAMVNLLVDNVITLNQLQLLAKAPFVFSVTEDNILTAKTYLSNLMNDKPAIFLNAMGEFNARDIVAPTEAKIDPELVRLYDRFEAQILDWIGLPCVPTFKAAQQSVSEVQSNDTKLYLRRLEKLNCREEACDRINEMFGINCTVSSVVDEKLEELTQLSEDPKYDDDPGDDDNVTD